MLLITSYTVSDVNAIIKHYNSSTLPSDHHEMTQSAGLCEVLKSNYGSRSSK